MSPQGRLVTGPVAKPCDCSYARTASPVCGPILLYAPMRRSLSYDALGQQWVTINGFVEEQYKSVLRPYKEHYAVTRHGLCTEALSNLLTQHPKETWQEARVRPPIAVH